MHIYSILTPQGNTAIISLFIALYSGTLLSTGHSAKNTLWNCYALKECKYLVVSSSDKVFKKKDVFLSYLADLQFSSSLNTNIISILEHNTLHSRSPQKPMEFDKETYAGR